MKPREVNAYLTSDGRLFISEEKATGHQIDLLGQALADLLPHDERGNVTQSDRFRLLKAQMEDPLFLSSIRQDARNTIRIALLTR